MLTPNSTSSKPRERRQRVDFPPLSRRPVFLCYDKDFVANDRSYKAGVYCHDIKSASGKGGKGGKGGKDGNEGDLPVDQWICSVLKVVSIVRSNTGSEHAYLIEYVAHGETEMRRTLLPQSLLLGRADEPLKALRALGVSVLRGMAKGVLDYLDREHLRFSSQRPQDFWRSVQTTGWAPYPTCFALPYETLRNGSDTDGVWYAGNAQDEIFARKGTFEDWQNKVAALCEGNSFLVLSVCTALSGPLLDPLNIQGLGFHINGDSSSGKTTTQYAAVSVWGPRKFLLPWRSTANGLEAQAATRSSTLLALDESHQVDPKTLDLAVYLLLNGCAKTRMSRDIMLRAAATWRLPVLSSGENAIEMHLTAAKIDHKAGQAVRMIDISVCGKYGLFDDIKGRKDAAGFADEIQHAAATNYGHAGPGFVKRLIEEHATINLSNELTEIMQAFEQGEAQLTPQEKRVARSFAVIALAGEMAIRWKIVPWQKGHAATAARELFSIWRATQPQAPHGRETAQILSRITEFLDRHGNSRFLDVNWVKPSDYSDDNPKIINQAGYFEHAQGKKIYLFTASGLQEAVGNFTISRTIEAIQAVGGFTDIGSGKTAKLGGFLKAG